MFLQSLFVAVNIKDLGLASRRSFRADILSVETDSYGSNRSRREDQRIDQLTMWKCPAAAKVIKIDRGRVSDSAQAASVGSHPEATAVPGHSHRNLGNL